MTPPDDATIAPFDSAQGRALSPSESPTPRSNRFAPGAIVAGRYRLVALLGRGGIGEVYRAEDLTLDQPVALKFLPETGERSLIPGPVPQRAAHRATSVAQERLPALRPRRG